MIDYHQNKDLWQLSQKGEFLKNTPFLSKAVTMWARVASEENWLKIPDLLKKKTLSSFPSFKEKETSEGAKTKFYQALIGYTTLDTQKFRDKINIEDNKNILLFGVHSLALIPVLTNQGINIINLDYYNDNQIPAELIENYNIEPIEPGEISQNYDLAIFCRFLQHLDDEKVLSYLKLANSKKISRILLIETILTDDSPIGGAVDINIMVETGGRLRTLRDWEVILKQVEGLKISNVEPLTDYLSIIDIRY